MAPSSGLPSSGLPSSEPRPCELPLYELPLVRAGRAVRSAQTLALAGVDGTPLATVHQAPPLLARLTVAEVREHCAGQDPDSAPDPALLRRAGRLFATATLGGLTPERYCELQARAAGVPVSVARHSLTDVARTFANAGARIAAECPPGATGVISPGEVSAVWARRGEVLAVIAPSNNPGTHTQWLTALACGYALLVRPGARDPFTPARMIDALLRAGVPPHLLSLLPGSHATGDALVEAADLSLVFGGDAAARRYGHDRRVILRGPGRSKLLHSGPVTDEVLDVICDSVGHDAGMRCTNATAVFTDGDPRALARAVAARLAPLTPAPPQSDEARLPVLPLAEARALREHLTRRLDGAVDVAAAHYPDGPLADLGDGSAALRPAVLLCERADHPGARVELSFPCVWVLPWRRSQGMAPLRDTLALTVLSDDPALAREALRERSIRKVLFGPVPTWSAGEVSPHDGYLSHELMEARGYGVADRLL
ncbi:aldehyde dehydrogenase family protein [Streptomyces sp. N2-109]|uniref:Aldehyde dehydrogenase family protein n=1 Tax=Streptomyces gossypii TaxID=2883101 RepID=A0ABT2JSW6_9ACTN|nr:aldehyde dehydrogenase family protein [Streptomyces gossypii]MCT2590983.1 aldehyde dehydrogenase family protein [Streptomyces gossypii]